MTTSDQTWRRQPLRRLVSRDQLWTWLIVLGFLVTSGTLFSLERQQRRVSERAIRLAAELAKTRLELADGLALFLREDNGSLTQASHRGRDALRKAVARLQDLAARADPDGQPDGEELAHGSDLAQAASRLEEALASADPRQREDLVEAAVGALESLVDRIDSTIHLDLERLLARHGRRLSAVLLGALALLATLAAGASIASRLRRRSEARFRQLFDAAPVALAYSATDGTVASINRHFVATFGYLPEDLPDIEAWWRQAYPDPAYRAAVSAAWLEAVARAAAGGREIRPASYRVTTKGGIVRNVEITGIVLDDGLLVMLVDHTERDQALARLVRNEALLEETGRLAKVGGWAFDPGTGAGWWTPEVAHIHELDPTSPVAVSSCLARYVGPSRLALEQAVARAVSDAEPYDLQLELVTAAGRKRWVRSIGYPILEAGKVVRVQGSFQDVTEIVGAHAAVRASEERLRSLVENASDIITVLALDGTVRYQSPAVERVLGYEPGPADGARALDFVHPEDVPRVCEAMAQAHQLTPPSLTLELRVRHRDGSWRTIQAIGTRAKLDGDETVIVVNSRDVTAERSLQGQLLRAQRLEAVGSLASGLAHDLNNLLAPIGLVAGLLQETVCDPKAVESLQLIETNVARGSAIIRQLLTFGRGGGGDRVSVQLRHLVQEMVAIMRETFPRTIEVESVVADELWTVAGDATQLHQVLMNLCVNARDAMASGGRLRLELDNVTLDDDDVRPLPDLRPGRYVRWVVRDSGSGIAPETLPRVFDPFFTTKAVGQGSGLGLSAVLGIVRRHGGAIGVDSTLGAGTTFTIHLPAEDSLRRPPPAAPTPPVAGRGQLVLVVDDESALRTVTRTLLEAAGYRVEAAENGRDALAAVDRLGADIGLLLTDLAMPAMGGAELAQQVRRRHLDLPILITTGLGDGDALRGLAALGIDHVLPKPYTAANLLAAVAAALAPSAHDH